MIGVIVAAVLSVWGSVYIGIKTFNSISYSDIHESTDWRKNLMDIASKAEISLDDIYRMRASVYATKVNAYKIDYLTIRYCSYMISTYTNPESDFPSKDMEIGRIICRGLLHTNWVYNTKKIKKIKKSDGDEVYNNILNEILMCNSSENFFIRFVTDQLANTP